MVATWVPIDVDYVDEEPPPAVDGWAVLLRAIEDRRPDWQLDAACRYAEDVTFFPERGESLEPARAVCARCPVDLQCELYAVALDAEHGVWAGQSARKLKRQRAA